jgi:hypothetical protein
MHTATSKTPTGYSTWYEHSHCIPFAYCYTGALPPHSTSESFRFDVKRPFPGNLGVIVADEDMPLCVVDVARYYIFVCMFLCPWLRWGRIIPDATSQLPWPTPWHGPPGPSVSVNARPCRGIPRTILLTTTLRLR